MGTQRTIYKLGAQFKIYILLISLASFSPTVFAEYYLVYQSPCGVGCFSRIHHHRCHHRRHHHYRRHHCWRSASASSICTGWSPGYEVYTSLPDYGTICDGGSGNYDPPNLSPFQDDIHADYNLTW